MEEFAIAPLLSFYFHPLILSSGRRIIRRKQFAISIEYGMLLKKGDGGRRMKRIYLTGFMGAGKT